MKDYIMKNKYDLFIRKSADNEPNANIASRWCVSCS